jgi:hypothetical protein
MPERIAEDNRTEDEVGSASQNFSKPEPPQHNQDGDDHPVNTWENEGGKCS